MHNTGGTKVAATERVIRARLIRNGQGPTDIAVDEIEALLTDATSLVWLDLLAPSDDELGRITRLLRIEERAVEALRRLKRRPLVRVFQDAYLVVAFSVDVHEETPSPKVTPIEVDVLAGRNFVASLHVLPLPFADELDMRTRTMPRVGNFDAAYLLYILLDSLIGQFAREFAEVENKVERLEERLLREAGRGGLDEAILVKRHVLLLHRLIAAHREAFGTLVAADIPPLRREESEGIFRDLVEHLDTVVDRLDRARDVLTNSFNLYISNISYRTNQQLRVLTFLSAVLLPMTVVTGLFGTNFALDEFHYAQPFYVMLAGLGLMAAGMLAFFRWHRWL